MGSGSRPQVVGKAERGSLKPSNKKKSSRRHVRATARRRPGSSRDKARATRRLDRRNTNHVSKPKLSSTVSRSRATNPARATHSAHARPATRPARSRSEPIPSPLPQRHVAPARPVLVSPARSMPPTREQRKPVVAPARGPLVMPDFGEAGVLLAITYSIREGRRGEFFDLLRELKPLLATIGGAEFTVFEEHKPAEYLL